MYEYNWEKAKQARYTEQWQTSCPLVQGSELYPNYEMYIHAVWESRQIRLIEWRAHRRLHIYGEKAAKEFMNEKYIGDTKFRAMADSHYRDIEILNDKNKLEVEMGIIEQMEKDHDTYKAAKKIADKNYDKLENKRSRFWEIVGQTPIEKSLIYNAKKYGPSVGILVFGIIALFIASIVQTLAGIVFMVCALTAGVLWASNHFKERGYRLEFLNNRIKSHNRRRGH